MSRVTIKSVMAALAGVLLAMVLVAALPWFSARIAEQFVVRMLGVGFGLSANIEHTQISWWPLAIDMEGVDISHPGVHPVRFSRIHADIEYAPLLSGTLSIPLMRIDGVAIGQRPEHAAVGSALSSKSAGESPVFPDMQPLPMPALVAAEVAHYAQQIKSFQQALRDKRASWEMRLQELPGDAELADLREQVDALQKVGKSVSSTDAVAKRLDSELTRFAVIDQTLREDWQRIQNQYLALKQMSEQSLNRILQQRGLSDAQLAAVGRSLVQDTVREWFDRGLGFHGVLSGREDLVDGHSQPALLHLFVHRVEVGGMFTHGARQGEISGEILNLADAPARLAEPLTLHLDAHGESLGNLQLSALLDHRAPDGEADHFNFSLQNTQFPRFVLAENEALAVSLRKVMLSVDMAGTISHEGTLDLSLSSVFNTQSVNVEAKSADNALINAMTPALKRVHEVVLTGAVKGSLAQPELQTTTSLDEVLAPVARQVVEATLADQKTELSDQLDGELLRLLAGAEGDLTQSSAMLDAARQRAEPFKRLRNFLTP